MNDKGKRYPLRTIISTQLKCFAVLQKRKINLSSVLTNLLQIQLKVTPLNNIDLILGYIGDGGGGASMDKTDVTSSLLQDSKWSHEAMDFHLKIMVE